MPDNFFGPLPKPELDLNYLKQWVQNNVDTFRRGIVMQGTLQSANWVNNTTGWQMLVSGEVEFNGEVEMRGASNVFIGGDTGAGTSAQVFIAGTAEQLNIRETDSAAPLWRFVIDAHAEVARLMWRDPTGPTFHQGLHMDRAGQLRVLDGTAGAPSISFQASGQQDVGFFRAATDEIGFAVGGAEVLRIDGAGVTDHKDVGIVKARAQTLAASTISTTETVELTATLTIPTDWNTYDIEAVSSFDSFESGTITALRELDFRIRLTNASGTIIGHQEPIIDVAAPGARVPGGVVGYIESQSATGSVPVVLTAQIGNDSGQASIRNMTMIVTAYRTS